MEKRMRAHEICVGVHGEKFRDPKEAWRAWADAFLTSMDRFGPFRSWRTPPEMNCRDGNFMVYARAMLGEKN